jgi:hypothetical protein
MGTLELERGEAEVEELERLWAAPAVAAKSRRTPKLLGPLHRVVGYGWAAFVVGVLALEPVSNPAAATPLWAEVTLAAFWLALLTAGLLAVLGVARGALGASALAGFTGVALGYACSATEHHLGAWWLVEAGACGALGLLSLAALAARR